MLSVNNKVTALRSQMNFNQVQAYVIPHADEHQSEYLDAYAERLAWLTDFTGSAGSAIVLPERAAIFVDGRYTLQAANQVDQNVFEIVHIANETPTQWLGKHLNKGDKIGIDAWLHTYADIQRFETLCEQTQTSLALLDENLIDVIWEDQPLPSSNSAFVHELKYSGREHLDKINQIAAEMRRGNIDYVALSALSSICWLLNIRGSDVEDTPVVFAFAVVGADSTVHLFIDSTKISSEVRDHLGEQVKIYDKLAIRDFLSALPASSKVQIDPKNTPYQFIKLLTAQIIKAQDPCLLPSACKNDIEIQGVKNAHRRDGAALCNFFAWLDIKLKDNCPITEMDVVNKLLTFRQEQELFFSNSFATIAGSGPNGAIIHYRVYAASNRLINQDVIFLLDSGGQYYDGTTDLTRVVAIGEPTLEHKDRFTRVLKGHIALATVVFPRGTMGSQLDVLARSFLWQAGLDYAHGTGHGVGNFLGVHDGPQRVGKSTNNDVALQAGMVLSNEPGYYKAGEYGFRIESLLLVKTMAIPQAEHEMLGFETISLAPIEKKLIDLSLLSSLEINWINDYHSQIREKLLPIVNKESISWLMAATEPL